MMKKPVIGLVLAILCIGVLAATASYQVSCPYCGTVGTYKHTANLNAWFYDSCVKCKKNFIFEVKNSQVVKVQKTS